MFDKSLLEILAVDSGGKECVVVCFKRSVKTDPVPANFVVGQVELNNKQIDWKTFAPNTTFIDTYSKYLRGEMKVAPTVMNYAKAEPGGYFYLVDGRVTDPNGRVAPYDIIGSYKTDHEGKPLLSSFDYNKKHALVLPDGTFSSILEDKNVYAMLLSLL